MCTVMFFRETLPAEKRSVEESRKEVDRLMEHDRLPSCSYGDGGRIFVWLDNMCFGNSNKRGFYYVRDQLSMLYMGSTAYAHPRLIVQKSKLRPDQIEYMERKCRETREAAERAAAAERRNYKAAE